MIGVAEAGRRLTASGDGQARLFEQALDHAEIAARLFISVRTVESHVASLRRKLCVGTHRELVRLAAGYRAAVTGPGPGASPRLPAPLTSFVGRDGERAALAAALGASRLVSAVGPGGIGKTRLAIAVAADVADRFGGTWYADLVPVTDPALLPAAVLACLGADESSSRPAQDVLAAALGERRALLVLDNCEHLVNAVAVLTERLLSACAEHVNRFAGMYAGLPTAGTAAGLLADARARAGDDPRAAAAIGSAGAQNPGLTGAQAAERAGRALRLARQTGDPLLISAAYDAVTAGLMTEGDIHGAAATAAERVSMLPPLGRDPRVAFELKDALHTAIFTGVAAGQVARSLDHAEQHYGLPFLREERDLGCEDLIAPAALAGQGDRALTLGRQWRRGWEHAGRPVAVGRSMAPAAIAMVYGLRGDDAARAGWLAILAAVRGVAEHDAVRGSGCGEVFEAIVLLDRGEAHAALDLLAAATAGDSSWRTRLWHQWMAALRAEAAVLVRTPDATRLVAEAEAAADRNPVAIALTRRAGALFRGDADGALGTATAFGQAGVPLPAGPHPRPGRRPPLIFVA